MPNDSSEAGIGLIVVRFEPVFSTAQPQGNNRLFHSSFRADTAPFERTSGVESFGPLSNMQLTGKTTVKKVPVVLVVYVWRV